MARKSDSAAELKPTSEIPAERCKQTHVPSAYTYINHIGDVMDVIFCHNCICCCQVQQIVIPGFCAFQLVLRVLGLPLGRRQDTEQMKEGKEKKRQCRKIKQWGEFECVLRQLQLWDHQTGRDGGVNRLWSNLPSTTSLVFSHYSVSWVPDAAECGCWQTSTQGGSIFSELNERMIFNTEKW